MMTLDHLSQLLLASLDDVERASTLLNTTMQQAMQPVFELSLDGVIWYLNGEAANALGVTPQQAVGTRLTTYVTDGLMTQRHLDAVRERRQAQSWPDAWQHDPHPIPCQLTGFAIPRSLGSERPRIILWSAPVGPGDPTHALEDRVPPRETLLPNEGCIRGKHLDPLRKKLNKGANRFCELLGIAAVTWYAWRRQPETPIPSRTVELHLRLLDAMPDLARPGAHPLDLQEALRTQRGIQLNFRELALLMGIEGSAGYAWAHGRQANDQVQALTATLLQVLAEKPREAWEQYRKLVDHQARIENIDLWAAKSWVPPTDEAADQKNEGQETGSPASPTDPASPVMNTAKRLRGRPRSTQKKKPP
jgi:hypothetical protein